MAGKDKYCTNEECEMFNTDVDRHSFDMYIRGLIYLSKDDQKKEMTCASCGGSLSVRPYEDRNQCASIARFNSMSNEDKKKMLNKRARQAMSEKKAADIKREWMHKNL